ncbi:S-(hydroxymethyl)glutathione synthase [Massilia glaciei]|uniref:S-(Hydroxymethyl)glutathione synthase n=1 Tax=Massilia glaciei TaxID=1524097 RepID=A0A2U2HFJ8_9BURK|nr:S-(hydroxymethyl)glutathione synthase [Massilia glaciei]
MPSLPLREVPTFRPGTVRDVFPGIKIVQGEETLRLYQFNTKTAKHFFCGHCGIYTHHQRRSNPAEYGYNVGCLEGVNPFELETVPTSDGVNHPAGRSF